LNAHFGIGIFDLYHEIFETHFKYVPKYPVKLVIPKIPVKNSLLWASIFGELPEEILATVKKNYLEPLEIKEVNIEVSKVGELFKSNNIFPRRVTQGNLNHYRRSSFLTDATVFYFDASKPQDIVDFWNLRALGRPVFPMPKQFQENQSFRNVLIEFIKSNREEWKHQPGVFDTAVLIRGRHCSMDEMQKFAATINIQPNAGDTSNHHYLNLQHWYPRIWEEGSRGYDRADPNDFYENQTSIDISDIDKFRIHFNPVFPKFAKDRSLKSEPCCANEISFRFYSGTEHLAEVLPKSAGDKFIHAISSLGSFRKEWRVGRNGLVYLVKDTYKEHWDVPPSERVFFAWLEDQGWSPELSTPGILAKQIYKQLDGNVNLLANETLLMVLDHMNGGKNLYKETPTTQIELEDGRDLSVAKVKGKLKGLHDYLLSKGIFRIGLKIQCPNCFRKSWYSLEDIKNICVCPKCINSFPSIGNIDNSTWSYKTVGPFSVPQHADGAFSVLLGLNFFNEHHTGGVKLSPVFSFNAKNKDGTTLEADFAGFWQQSFARSSSDGLLFAECKTYNEFTKKDFDRMSLLAKRFPGAVIVFCTLRKKFTQKEIKNLTRIAKTGRKYWKNNQPINPVLILTFNELSDYRGIPYCWDAELQKRFQYLRGLLNVCAATQYVYLGLPSWEDDWNKKWQKKHEAMIKRRNM
jgi:hypothetical protein